MQRWHPMDLQRFEWPQPRPILFRDRTTSTLYMLTHNSDTDTITVLTPVPNQAHGRPEEPLLTSPIGNLRIYVTGGSLRYETVGATEEGRRDERLFTLNYADKRTTYRIRADGVTRFGDPLGLTRYDNLGRTTVITDLGNVLFVIPGDEIFEEAVFEEGVFT